MRFTIIGHAAVRIETSGPSILLDPWLSGSAYWRSWWHYPPALEVPEAWLSPDYLYITHIHFDHMHFPSLRRLDKATRVLIPRFGVPDMADEMRGLGFPYIEELPHAKVVWLTPTVRIASYQYGFDDTAVVIADGDDVLLNCNDAKIKGRALRQITDEFGPPTFLWKNHSYSITYPLCYEAEDPSDLSLVTRESFVDDFLEVVREVRPRYAVPFASSIAFLHPETLACNDEIILPGEIKARFDRADDVEGTECVVLVPGDSWDSVEGFQRSGEDWEIDHDARIAALAKEVAPIVERSPIEDPTRALEFAAFRDHVEAFCRVLPPGVARVLLPRPMVFEIEGDDAPYWTIDFVRRRVERRTELPSNWAGIVRASPAMIADMLDKHLLSNLVGTMRIHVRLAPGGVSTDLAFWGLLMVWDTRYLPLSRILNVRFIQTLWARRREAIDQVLALARGTGSPLRRLSQGFTPRSKHRNVT